jgi:glutathione reductase (NADPH)
MVPTVVFSHPLIATCGMTEALAIAKYGMDNLKIYNITFVYLYYSKFDVDPSENQIQRCRLFVPAWMRL